MITTATAQYGIAPMHTGCPHKTTYGQKADTALQQLLFTSVVPLNDYKTWQAWLRD